MKALAYLANTHPTLRPTAEMAQAWTAALADLTDEEIVRAADVVSRTHVHGAPSTANLVEAVRGRVERRLVPVEHPDGFGGTYRQLKPNGEPVSEWREARVFPDGREEPLPLPVGDDPELPCELDDRHGVGLLSDDLDWRLSQLDGSDADEDGEGAAA